MTAPAGEKKLIDKIKTRGYFDTVVRPATFVEQRANRNDLFDIVERTRVRLRGWDFPHVDRGQPHIDVEWVGQSYEWEHRIEIWRLYRSGQFVSISGIPNEWRDQSGFWPSPKSGWAPNRFLGVGEVIATFTEIFEFAARLSQTPVGDERIHILVTLAMMHGRVLMLDSARRGQFTDVYGASIDRIPIEHLVTRVDLCARPRELAVECAEEVFSFFGWKPVRQILVDVQNEIFSP